MTDVAGSLAPRRLPFAFRVKGGAGRLWLARQAVGPYVEIDRLELELAQISVEEPEDAPPERFQKRRTQLGRLSVRVGQEALRQRIEATRRQLAALGISQVSARFCDGFVAVRARVADGLAAADISFRVVVTTAGPLLRAMAGAIRVHGHLPVPGPLLADRIVSAVLAAGESDGDRASRTRGLCDIEIDLVGALLWQLLPPHGWRLPKTNGVELTTLRIARSGVEIAYAPLGARADTGVGIGATAIQLAAAHDLMRTADELLRDGQLEDAMRGYRSLLASGGPDQPIVLGRLLALATTRSAWFYDGVELGRQALVRWPHYAPAHAALASILLAQGDAREAASHLHALARLASGEGDDDEAALAALAGARLLRILDPRASTQLYQLALEHDPGSIEAADALADRLTDEARWPELVRLLRARAVIAASERAAQLRLRLAEVLAQKLGDEAGAQAEVQAAMALLPDEPAVHELWATLRLASGDVTGATAAWRTVVELAQRRSEPGDRRTEARAWARLGALLSPDEAEAAWRRALELYPAEPEAIEGLARTHRDRGEQAEAVLLYERVRGAGLPLTTAAHFELEMAKCQIELQRLDDARASLRRAAVGRSEVAAEAHALLAEISALSDPHHAAAELDTAIASLVDLAEGAFAAEGHRLFRRAAELAVVRAGLLDRQGDEGAAADDLQRAHYLAADHDALVARQAARALLGRAGDDAAAERRWLDAVLATDPPPGEKAELLMRSAGARRRQSPPDVGTALAEAREASRLSPDPEVRKRAFELEAELLADLGNQRARATALSSLAELTTSDGERAAAEIAAAAAWLAADDAATALPHAAAAAGTAETPEAAVAPALRRHILATFGEAAWRQRAWGDVVRAYSQLVGDTPPNAGERAAYLLRIAIAADKRGDSALAREHALAILEADRPASPSAVLAELRGNALRLLAELSDKAGDGPSAAATLERLAGAPAGEATPAARADALYRAGELFRRANQQEDAIRCLEAALRLSDAHLPALDSLELAWRALGDLERVAVVLGRKVAATRQSSRQKSLLVRLGDLQAQLGRPDVARATHKRALELDPTWRPSLRFLAAADLRAGQLAAAAKTYAALAGELASDAALHDPDEVARDRAAAALALADLLPALEGADLAAATAALATHRGTKEIDIALRAAGALDEDGAVDNAGPSEAEAPSAIEPPTLSQRSPENRVTSEQFRVSARAARQRGDLPAALAALETAQHLVPHDPALLGELVEVAQQAGDLPATARHLRALAATAPTANRRADALIELADLYYDQLDDARAARAAMLDAADILGPTARGDATLRMVASEAATHLAWNTVVTALERIADERRTGADLSQLGIALCRCGRDAQAIELVTAAQPRLGPAGAALLESLVAGQEAKRILATDLEARARGAAPTDAVPLWQELEGLLRDALGDLSAAERAADNARELAEAGRPARPGTWDDADEPTVQRARSASFAAAPTEAPPEPDEPDELAAPPSIDAPDISVAARAAEGDADDAADRLATPAALAEVAAGFDRAAATPPLALGLRPAPRPETSGAVVAVAETEPTQPYLGEAEPSRLRATQDEGDEGDDRPQNLLAATLDLAGRGRARTITSALSAVTREAAAPASAPDPAPAPERTGGRITRRLGRVVDPAAEARREAASLFRLANGELARARLDAATALLSRAYHLDPSYAPVLMPLADRLSAVGDLPASYRVFLEAAACADLSDARRRWARARAEALAALHPELPPLPPAFELETTPPAIDTPPAPVETDAPQAADAPAAVSAPPGPRTGEQPAASAEPLTSVLDLIDAGNLPAAIAAAERAAAEAEPGDLTALELLEDLYLEIGDGAAASEAIGRQLMMTEDPIVRATLWRRRARVYRELGREQQAYRCLKEAHTCAPDDADHAYELRCAAMARREWPLVVTLLEREIEAAPGDRDAAALWFELGLILDERLDDADKAIAAYEHALALDPSIPAVDLPLARRYERAGRNREAAAHFEAAERKTPLAFTRAAASGSTRDTAPVAAAATPELATAATERVAAVSERDLDADWDTAQKTPGPSAERIPVVALPAPPPRIATGSAIRPALTTAERLIASGELALDNRIGEDRFDLPQTPLPREHEGAEGAPPSGRRTTKRFPLVDASLAAIEPSVEPAPPPPPPLTQADLERALDDAHETGERTDVISAARRLWLASPGHPAAFLALASEHKLSGDLDALIDLTGVRAAMTPEGADRASLWIEVARLAEALGEDHQAARAYDLALIEDPSSSAALDARAGLAFRLGDFATAEMIYRDIEAADSMLSPDELLLRRSIIAEHVDRADEALTFAQAAAAAAPGRIDLQRRVQELATRAGDLATALPAARAVMSLVPPDQEDEVLASHFSLVGLLHAIGDHAGAIANLERLRRDHPQNREVIAALASVHADRGDWSAACQYLQMLVPLAATAQERALRLFELGEVFLNKVGDLERADDAFLRASDLDPGCVPALRRLIDSYWRADQIAPLLDIATDLVSRGALLEPEMDPASLARAAIVASIAHDDPLATGVLGALGADAPSAIAGVLIELVGRNAPLSLPAACQALRVLHDRGALDLGAIVAGAEHPAVRKALLAAAEL